MLKIKKLLLLTIALVLITQIALAAEGIEISLNSYDSETTIAKISLHNGATQDYHEVTLSLDSLSPTKIVDTLAAGTTILYPIVAPAGEHKITVTTKEGETFSKDLYFAKTQNQIQEEIQKEQEVQAEKEKKYQQIAEEKEKIESMKIKEENETEKEGLETPTASKETPPQPQISKDLILRIGLGITIVAFLGYIIFITIKEKTKKAYLFLLLGALLFLVKPTDAYLGCCSDTCYESGVCCGAASTWYQGCEDSNSQLYCPGQVLGDCANCFSTTPEDCTWYLNDTNCATNKECNIDGNMTNPISSHCLCKEGYTLCADGSCQTDCSGNGGDPPCVINGVCDSGESCTCADCDAQPADNCSEGLICINGVCQQQVGACSSCSDCDKVAGGCSFNSCTVTCGGQPCYYAGYSLLFRDCGACSETPACGDYEDTESTCGADTCGLANCFWDNVTTNCKTCTTCEDYSDQSMCETNDCSLDECHWCSASGCGESKPRNKCVTVPDDDMDGICNAGDTDPLCTGSDACPNTPLDVEVNDEGCSESQSSCLLEWDCTSSAWSSCENGVRTREPCVFIGPGGSTCNQPEFEPALTKACSTASLFSFFTTSNLLIVLLILIAFYIWQTSNKPKKTKKHKKKHKEKARRHRKK